MSKFEVNQAVGQPTADRPLGGRNVPDLKPARRNHTGRNLAVGLVGLGVVAAGVGVAINAGKGEPQSSQNPGGIVEPSTSPSPEQSITIPSATPGESFVATLPPPSPTPEITPTPEPTRIPVNTIVEGEHNPVEYDVIKQEVKEAYNQNPKAKSIWQYGVETVETCKTGDNEPNSKFNLQNREFACKAFVVNAYKVYLKTGDINFYNAAKDVYNYAISKEGLGKTYKIELDEYLVKAGLLPK